MIKTGVYKILCLPTSKLYVGSSAFSIRRRWAFHKKQLRLGKHGNRYLQRAWDKYGEAAFVFEVLEQCLPGDCIACEQLWIDKLNAANPECGFNLCPKAGSVLGLKFSLTLEQKKARRGKGGRMLSPEARDAIAVAIRDLWKNPEYRRVQVAVRIGVIPDDATRLKIGNASRERWLDPEQRTKMNSGKVGRKLSVETRKKISEARKRQSPPCLGKVWSVEERKRASKGQIERQAEAAKRLQPLPRVAVRSGNVTRSIHESG